MTGAGGPPAGVPGGAPAAPQIPPALRAGAPGAGPMTVPQGNPGNSLAAMSNVKTAVTLLQEALPAIPLGSALHGEVLKVIGSLGKHVGQQDANDQSQITQLQALIQKLSQQQPNAALARLAQQNPNAPPAMPQTQAPGGAAGAPPGVPMAA
jgi:hypothetical protein